MAQRDRMQGKGLLLALTASLAGTACFGAGWMPTPTVVWPSIHMETYGDHAGSLPEGTTEPISPIYRPVLGPTPMAVKARRRLAQVHPGMTRAALRRLARPIPASSLPQAATYAAWGDDQVRICVTFHLTTPHKASPTDTIRTVAGPYLAPPPMEIGGY